MNAQEQNQLEAELERNERDAARYRWLRSGSRSRQGIVQGGGARSIAFNALRSLMTFAFWCTPDELDSAIDSAIARESST
jgi:hypothetical protein